MKTPMELNADLSSGRLWSDAAVLSFADRPYVYRLVGHRERSPGHRERSPGRREGSPGAPKEASHEASPSVTAELTGLTVAETRTGAEAATAIATGIPTGAEATGAFEELGLSLTHRISRSAEGLRRP